MTEIRESKRSIPARYLTSLPEIFFFLFLFWTFGIQGDSKTSYALFWVNIVALVASLIAPIFEYKTHRFVITSHEFQLEKGWIEKETRKIPLDSIASFTVEQPWNYRLFNVYKVTCKQSGNDDADIVLSGIHKEDADTLRCAVHNRSNRTYNGTNGVRQAERSNTASEDISLEEPQTQIARNTLFSATYRDVVLMGVSYGQIFVLGAGAFFTASGFLEDIHVNDTTSRYIDLLPLWLLIPLAIVVGISIGLLLTTIRFYGFTVDVTDTGEVVICYGLFSRKQRHVSPQHLSGVTLQQNIIEKFFGLARLVVLSKDSSSALESNLVLPPVHLSIVRTVLDTSFQKLYTQGMWESFQQKRRVTPIVSFFLVIAVVVGSGYVLSIISSQRSIIAGGTIASFLLTFVIIRLVTTCFAWNSETAKFIATTVTFSTKTTVINGNSLVYVTSHRRSSNSRSLITRIKTYCGKTIRFTAIGVNSATMTNIQSFIQKGAQ